MSVRIHAIAKEVNKTSKEILDILSARGYELKSASSTIDNITAESLVEEFKSESSPAASSGDEVVKTKSSKTEDDSSDNDSSSSRIPLVKSKQDIEREKKEKEEAELAAVQADESVEEDLTSQNSQDREPNTEAKTPVMAPPPPTTKASAPPPPSSSAGKPQVPAPPTSTKKDVDVPLQDGVVEGNLVIVKPPIVVRDFAVLLGLKPFQLISELMEMGIFASMNQSIDEDVARKISKI